MPPCRLRLRRAKRRRYTGAATSSILEGKPMRRLLLVFGLLFLAFSSDGWSQGSAQPWPTKALKVVVPLTPGSATDVMARIVFDQVSQQVGQPIVIENRPGAGNSIGMNA